MICMPLSTLIENNNESMDVNVVGWNNFGNNAYRGNFNPRQFPSNPSNNYGNSYNNSFGNFNKMPYDFENSVKEFIVYQKNLMPCLKKNCLKLMIWLGTLIEFLLRLILQRLDLCHLRLILMNL